MKLVVTDCHYNMTLPGGWLPRRTAGRLLRALGYTGVAKMDFKGTKDGVFRLRDPAPFCRYIANQLRGEGSGT